MLLSGLNPPHRFLTLLFSSSPYSAASFCFHLAQNSYGQDQKVLIVNDRKVQSTRRWWHKNAWKEREDKRERWHGGYLLHWPWIRGHLGCFQNVEWLSHDSSKKEIRLKELLLYLLYKVHSNVSVLCFVLIFFFFFFDQEACRILASRPGIGPTSSVLEGKVLTTGLPGKSLLHFFTFNSLLDRILTHAFFKGLVNTYTFV